MLCGINSILDLLFTFPYSVFHAPFFCSPKESQLNKRRKNNIWMGLYYFLLKLYATGIAERLRQTKRQLLDARVHKFSNNVSK